MKNNEELLAQLNQLSLEYYNDVGTFLSKVRFKKRPVTPEELKICDQLNKTMQEVISKFHTIK